MGGESEGDNMPKVDEQWISSITSFQMQDVMGEDDYNRFERFIRDNILEESFDKIIVRFLIEDINHDKNTVLLAYAWVIYHLDTDKDIESVDLYIPDNSKSYLENPPIVGSRIFYKSDELLTL